MNHPHENGKASDAEERLIRLMLRARGYELLAELPDGPVAEVRETVRLGGRVLVLAVLPEGLFGGRAGPPAELLDGPQSPCERDVLEVLGALGSSPERRFVRPRIEREMDARGLLHGACTLGNALARLVRVGLLVNPHDHKGYGLPKPAAPAEGRLTP